MSCQSVTLVQCIIYVIQLIVNKIANDRIRTTDLWCWERPLYQLPHKRCHKFNVLIICFKNSNHIAALSFYLGPILRANTVIVDC